MRALLSARAAVLQALRGGPSYGDELRRWLLEGGELRLGHGPVYAALSGLAKAGLVRTWTARAGGGSRGRSRTYYELTRAGVKAARAQAEALARLLTAPPAPSAAERDRMRDRLIACDELSAAVYALRDAMLRHEAR